MTDPANMKVVVGKAFVAFVASGLINIFIFITLASLNSTRSFNYKFLPDTMPKLTLTKVIEQRKPKSPVSDVVQPEPQIMVVDLDHPAPQPFALKPIPLDSTMLEISEHIASTVGDFESAKSSIALRSVSDVDEPPRELVNIRPHYPQIARERGIEGLVVVKLLINERGLVEKIEVVRVEGHALFRKTVLAAARKWRFRPARHGGKLVKVWGIKRIRFELEK